MKRFLSVAFAALLALSLTAEDFNLYIVDNTSAKATYAVSDLQKITFESGNVVVTTTTGTTASVAISDIAKMYFNTETAEGIGSVAQASVTFNGQVLSFSGTADKVDIYTVSGALVASGRQLDGSAISLADMPDGVYVVRIDGQSFKVIKQ